MTYKKPLKGFSGTTLMGVSISATDTATSRLGSDAISAFEAHKIIKTEAENRKRLTPFHAVKAVQYGVSTEDAERTDPYCGGGTEPIDYGELLGEFESGSVSRGGCTTNALRDTDIVGEYLDISTIVVEGSVGTADINGIEELADVTYSNGIKFNCECDAESGDCSWYLDGYPDGTKFTLYYK